MAKRPAQIFHFDLFGKRDDKYEFLNENSLTSIAWEELQPQEPNLFFVPKDYETKNEYDKGFSVPELFPINSVGIVTARDNFTIHDTKNNVVETIEEFLELDDESARSRFNLGKDVRDWKVRYAKSDLNDSYFNNKGAVVKINYRVFDSKWTFYTGKSKGFHCYPRNEVMKHFINGKNLGLVTVNRQPDSNPVSYYFLSKLIISNGFIRSDSVSIDNITPLYLYPDNTDTLLAGSPAKRVPNLNKEIVDLIAKGLKLEFKTEKSGTSTELSNRGKFAPIDLLDYIYAVLYSPLYREKYKEFLKIDFPRVPYPKDQDMFWKLVELGGELRQIHLLESPVVEDYITQYPKSGDNIVTRSLTKNSPGFEPTENGLGRVWINDEQYFDNVPLVAWEFYIGGYQPAQKWLKDRRNRQLDFEDILHYQKIIVVLTETERIMREIEVD